jgi:peptidoglycan/LPS O-acetylase OafA/YrhL
LTQALFPLAIAYGVFTLAFSERLPLKRFTKYGDFSYGTYLYAFPIQQSLVALGARQFGFSAFVIASMLLSLAAGVASWYGVERWFLKRERTARAEHAPLPIHSEAPV